MLGPSMGPAKVVFDRPKKLVKDPDAKSRLGLMEYLEHGPCMTENFCL